MADVVVFTAVFGEYDVLERPVVPGTFMAYSDGAVFEGWQNWHVQRMHEPQRMARMIKCLTTFQQATTIWLDGNVQLLVPPEQLVEAWLGDGYDIATFRHPAHDCLYVEAEVCKHKLKDSEATINTQMAGYRAVGFPVHYGLAETAVLVRRGSDAVNRFNAGWWAEIAGGSVRDQLSFDFVRWVMGNEIRVHLVDGGPGWKRRIHPWFRCTKHRGG